MTNEVVKTEEEIRQEILKEQEKALRDQLVIDAKALGLTFAGNIGYKALKELYDEKVKENYDKELKEKLDKEYQDKLQEEIEKAKEEFKSKQDTSTNAITGNRDKVDFNTARLEAIKRANRLVRCKVQLMNPNKKEITGEIFTVSNSMIGTVRKMVPFDPKFYEDGYHIPFAIFNLLKKKKYLSVREVKTRDGYKYVTEYVNEFAVVELDPLTQEELDELAERQQNTHSLL